MKRIFIITAILFCLVPMFYSCTSQMDRDISDYIPPRTRPTVNSQKNDSILITAPV